MYLTSKRRHVVRAERMSSGPRHDGSRPKGPRNEMTLVWKDRVEAEIAARGRNRAWFAREIGVTRGFVTKLFKRKPDGSMLQIHSEAVPRICALLGLPPPLVDAPEDLDSKTQRIMDLIKDQPDAVKDGLLSMLEGLHGRR